MGVIYYAVCKDCRVKRDLDKFYPCEMSSESREEAIAVSEQIAKAHTFRAGLLATFMAEHYGHSCTLYKDSDWIESIENMPEDYDFWSTKK